MSKMKMLFTIVDRGKGQVAANLLREYGVCEHYIALGNGTAHKDWLGTMGLSDTAKDVLISFVTTASGRRVMARLSRVLDIDMPGKGIAFTCDLNGVAGPKTLAALTGEQTLTGTQEETEVDACTHDLIVAIVNRGFTDVVMDAARPVGARGGTVIHARGAGAKEAEKFLGITLQPEKEVVLILAKNEDRNAIMTAIAKAAGLSSEGQGLVFSLPAGDVMGVARQQNYMEE